MKTKNKNKLALADNSTFQDDTKTFLLEPQQLTIYILKFVIFILDIINVFPNIEKRRSC